MKNLGQLVLLVFALMNFSCNEFEEPNSTVIDTMAFITVLDANGNNLLNPNQEDSFQPGEIKIFYERKGKMEEFFQGNLDMPRNFRIEPPEFGSDYLMAVSLEEKTIIQWNDTQSDTLRAELALLGKKGAAGFMITKVFYKEDIKYDAGTANTRREFTIIK
jgi:hypothetical protein